MRTLATATVMIGLLLSTSCGGGGGGDDDPKPLQGTETIESSPLMDGLHDSPLLWGTPATISAAREPSVGYEDNGGNVYHTAVFTFDLSKIPAGVTIRSARLHVWQQRFDGDFVAHHAGVLVSHARVASPAPSFEIEMQVVEMSFAGMPADATKGYKDTNVTDQVAKDVADNRAYSCFFLKGNAPSGEGPGQTHLIYYTDGENFHDEQPPLLVVEWER